MCGRMWPSSSGETLFSNIVCVIPLCRYYVPLENGLILHLNKYETPSPKKKCFSDSREENEKVKSLQTDEVQPAIRNAHLSFQFSGANSRKLEV